MTADYRRAWKDSRGDPDAYQTFHLDMFSSGCFGAPFPASFKRRATATPASHGPHFIRCFGTALLSAKEPQVLGSPRHASEPTPPQLTARQLHCFWKWNWSTWAAAQHAPRQDANTPEPMQPTCHRWGMAWCHSSSASPTLTCPFCLSWIQQQLLQFIIVSTPMAQQSPPIPYRITEDTQTFWLTGQPVRSWKGTCMCQYASAIS